MRQIAVLSVLIIVSTVSMNAQSATPAPGTRKANERPAEKPVVVAEPFDKADVKTMAAKCVRLETEAGDIEIEMFPESAPESVRNFLNLASIGAYDTTNFGRVVPGFVIQGGNIWSRTSGVSRDLGVRARRAVPDEPNKILHERGIVSMARSDEPNSATTSFFILVDKAAYLDGKFAAFGRVIKGIETAEAINKAPGAEEKPEKPVKIRKASVLTCTSAVN